MCRSYWLLGMAFVFTPSLAAERPNIVVLLCDDLGYGDLQCYGHPHIKTPNLDRMAKRGARLTHCYSAAPVCSPSRVGLLTGRSPNRAGVYDWIPAAKGPRPDARDRVHMRESEQTLPGLLKQAGYRTCLTGKWHCNSRFNQPSQPQPNDFGFDHYLATQNNASPSHQNPDNFVRNGQRIGKVEDFSCQFVMEEAIQWLNRTAYQAKPFFLFVPFHEPHEPVASPDDLVAEYQSVASSDDEAQYCANVANVDAAIGRLTRELDRLGERDNTLMFFTSDNGPETLNRYRNANRSYGSPGPLRGMKLHTTEAGFRVPGILTWPAKIDAGQVIDRPISSLDLLPTLCGLAKAKIPAELELDGCDFLPLLEGKSRPRSKPLLWVYFNAINEHRVAMRDGRWKVLGKLNGGQLPKLQNVTKRSLPQVQNARVTDVEIYDMWSDNGESQPVLDDGKDLHKRYSEILQEAYDQLVSSSVSW